MKRSVSAFFLLTFAITWGLQLPGVLAKLGVIAGPFERFLPLMGLGALGPLLAATVMASREGGKEGRRALYRRFTIGPVGVGWYPLALLLSGVLFLAARAVYALFGGGGAWAYLPHEAATLTATVVFSVGEEVGWRGYALPRLLPRYGVVGASAVVGVVWCVWHAMMMVVSDVPLWMLGAMVPFFVAGSVAFTRLYQHTRGSLLIAVLMHMGAHLNNSNKPMPADLTPMLLHSAAFGVFAIAVLAFDPVMKRRDDLALSSRV